MYEDPIPEPSETTEATEPVWVHFFGEVRQMGPGGTVLATVRGPGV